jgi:SsrA-binding protein
MAGKKKKTEDPDVKIIVRNRKARFLYEIVDFFEAGIVLQGSEVKSLRDGRVSISDSYATEIDGEFYLLNLHISAYENASVDHHDPLRKRKLLLHRREIRRLTARVKEQGLTLVPTKLYFRKGKAKVELGLGRGKKKYDKRDTIAKRDANRDMERHHAGRDY